jgi:hypothetical protein
MHLRLPSSSHMTNLVCMSMLSARAPIAAAALLPLLALALRGGRRV